MVTLFEQDIRQENRQSSKGNQLKWCSGGKWYKADYTGYEGLAEYVVSHLMELSTLSADEFLMYDTVKIKYNETIYQGCQSNNFLPPNWQMITLERLFWQHFGESLYQNVFRINDIENKELFLVEQVENLTGLQEVGRYISILLTIDAFFLNEDRHTHNIAVLMDEFGKYHYCPFFDHGASLLADTKMDYPMDAPLDRLYEKPKAKTFYRDFDEQLDIAEKLYGQHIKFKFTNADVEKILNNEQEYSQDIKERVRELIRRQRRKYQVTIHGLADKEKPR